MSYASVVIDIATRALEGSFDYVVPDALKDQVKVGATVLVSFSHRACVGYVVALSETPPKGVAAHKILPIERVLAAAAFDEKAAELALWIAREYAAPLPDALRLFLAPGQTTRVKRSDDTGEWELVLEKAGPVDDRWVELSAQGRDFVPKQNASRQRAIIEALKAGPMRLAELTATIDGARSAVAALEKRGVLEVALRRRIRGAEQSSLSSATAVRPQKLTQGQRAALAAIEQAGPGECVLVDGVTGSGKTEVYLAAIERVLAQDKSALVLVPEISLTAQTVGRFRSRFGEDVAVLHSRLSAGERFDQWDLIRMGHAHVVVGARSALFAPLHNLGLIIIDEEHENSYKQDQSPRYHAREVAAKLAELRTCPLVLGSATPSLESLARTQAGSWREHRWTRVEMPERPGDAVLPQVCIVNMAEEFTGGNRSIFSSALVEGLEGVLERREKAVLFLNRRGFASFLMCRECGCVPECPHCSTALTYHERTHALMCHSCGSSWPIRAYPDPGTACPNCGSRFLAQFGLGTQRVEDELALLVGERAEIIRMDADTTRGKGDHQRLLERFDAARCAVLVGTQMIAKGLDFPEVTLVGVINADTTLKLPDFRAGERTHDLLEQVAGRAGRGKHPGQVIVQSYWASHHAIRSVQAHTRADFLRQELAQRAEAYYPPFSRLTNVVVWGRSSREVEGFIERIASQLRASLPDSQSWQLLGPAECVKARVKDRYRRHLMLKSPLDSSPGELVRSCAAAAAQPRGVSLAIDVDAYDLM